MSRYRDLTVSDVVKETEDSVTIKFAQPEHKIEYNSGQFLTLILNIDGEEVRRSYSLCTACDIDEEPAVTVKRVPGGKASNYLVDNIRTGSVIKIMEPMGNFSLIPDANRKKDYVLIGGGSGITPLMSILKTILHKEPESRVYLLLGNRDEEHIIFKDELANLSERYPERFTLLHVLSQPKNNTFHPKGRMNRSSILKMLEQFQDLHIKEAEYYLCGPEGLMDEAREALDLLHIETACIHKESFVNTATPEPKGEVVEEDQSGPKDVTIIYEGTEYKVTVPPDKSILQAALAEDIDLPFSCQAGMCTACMGVCKSGKVHLQDQEALTDAEMEEGYVLTCVGHPVTSNVVIEID